MTNYTDLSTEKADCSQSDGRVGMQSEKNCKQTSNNS